MTLWVFQKRFNEKFHPVAGILLIGREDSNAAYPATQRSIPNADSTSCSTPLCRGACYAPLTQHSSCGCRGESGCTCEGSQQRRRRAARRVFLRTRELRLCRHSGAGLTTYFFGALANRRYGSLMSIAPNFSLACASFRPNPTITSWPGTQFAGVAIGTPSVA